MVEKTCAYCGRQMISDPLEVTVKIRGLVYLTFVPAQACPICRETKIDRNALGAFKIGMAMRAVETGGLTGRRHAYCRKALHIGSAELAGRLNISTECLLALEDTDTPVPDPMFAFLARRVRRHFKSLDFVPRIPLDKLDFRTPKSIDA